MNLSLHTPGSSLKTQDSVLKRWKRLLLALAVTVILIAALVAWWVNTHTLAISRYLEVSQPPQQADLIVVLKGPPLDSRLAKAADLVAKGYASRILLSGFADRSAVEGFKIRYKIPEESLIVEADSTNTYTNATRSTQLIRRNRARTVILVTSWWHSRRALNTFRHVMPDVRFISVPTPRASWSQSREVVNLEFRKLCFYAIAYRGALW